MIDIIQTTQYGTLFAAFGCTTVYNSQEGTLSVKDVPKGSKGVVDTVLSEIKWYDDTRNYVDGMAALALANYIDDHANPIKEESRLNVLHSLGIMQDGRYIRQALMLQKNNRSWHYSSIANECSYFGEECTHRGINPNPERTGRRSNRKPDEYHNDNGKGIVREQLVTNGLEEMFRLIPEDNLISAKPQTDGTIDLRAFKRLPLDRQLAMIEDLKESVHA